MAFSTFTMLYNHHYCLVPEHSYPPKRNPGPSVPLNPRQPLIYFLKYG